MRIRLGGAVTALVLLASAVARADDPPIPGLQMDDLSKQVVGAWREKTAREPIHYAQAPIRIVHARAVDRPPLAEGIYRFELATAEITWTDPARGRMLEQAWWRAQLDWLVREPGLLFFLANSTLTAAGSPTGTTIRVEGRSPLKVIRFDAQGDLVGLSVRQQGPGGVVQDSTVKLVNARIGGHLLLERYVMETAGPGGQAMKEEGRIVWTLVHGRPMPRDLLLGVQQGPQKLDLVVKVTPWKLGDEAQPAMDLASARALGAWESREYNLGRWGIEKGRCDVEVEVDGVARHGTYEWDGSKGSVTWQDPKTEEALEPGWRATLDDFFRPYGMREDLGVRELQAARSADATVIQVEDPYGFGEFRGYRRLTFAADGTLKEVVQLLPGGVEDVYVPTWYRVTYPEGHVFEGMLQYEVPAQWVGTWKDHEGGAHTTTRTFRYVAQDGLHVPSRLEIRTEGGADGPTTTVFTFRAWKLTKAPRLPER